MKTKLTFPGLKELSPPVRSGAGSAASMSVIGAVRALFRLPDAGVAGQRRSMVDFLAQVSIFEDLARRRDLARLAHIVHERDYGDGEYLRRRAARRGAVHRAARGGRGRQAPRACGRCPSPFWSRRPHSRSRPPSGRGDPLVLRAGARAGLVAGARPNPTSTR